VQSSIPRFLEILKVLTRRRVDFIIVGGVSAVLHGAPVTTFDLDVVHARDRENVSRLLSALEELEAVYRVQPERQLRPGEEHLAGPGHQLLLTKFGPLDVLGMIGKSRTWKDLLASARTMEIEPGMVVRVLDLETLIAVKEELGSQKDTAVLPILRQALKERSKRHG
jgi:predicted nucleotidyltransferase